MRVSPSIRFKFKWFLANSPLKFINNCVFTTHYFKAKYIFWGKYFNFCLFKNPQNSNSTFTQSMFYSRTTPKFAQKRHYPRGESDDTFFCQDPDVNPILKKNKLFNSFPNTSKFSDFNDQNGAPVTYKYISPHNLNYNNNNNYNKPLFGNQMYNNTMRETFQPSKNYGGFIEEERRDREDEKR